MCVFVCRCFNLQITEIDWIDFIEQKRNGYIYLKEKTVHHASSSIYRFIFIVLDILDCVLSSVFWFCSRIDIYGVIDIFLICFFLELWHTLSEKEYTIWIIFQYTPVGHWLFFQPFFCVCLRGWESRSFRLRCSSDGWWWCGQVVVVGFVCLWFWLSCLLVGDWFEMWMSYTRTEKENIHIFGFDEFGVVFI